MKRIANNDNKTMNITKGKEYDVYYLEDKGLVSVKNDIGDEVVVFARYFDWR